MQPTTESGIAGVIWIALFLLLLGLAVGVSAPASIQSKPMPLPVTVPAADCCPGSWCPVGMRFCREIYSK